MTEMQPHM